MRVNDANPLKLLPRFMRDERVARALFAAIQPTLKRLTKSADAMKLYDYDQMSEKLLDELAWQRNVLWYDYASDISIKRAVIKSAPEIYRILGTKQAIIQAVADYFGDAIVQEMWEYGGEPFHFRIYTSNPDAVEKNGAKLRAIVELVKRASAIMDGIYVGSSLTARTYIAVVAQNHKVITFGMEMR